MSEDSKEYDETHAGSVSSPLSRSTVPTDLESTSPTPTSPSSGITSPTLSAGRTSTSSDSEIPWSYPDLTSLKDDPRRNPVILPLPGTHQARPRRPKYFQNPIKSTVHNVGEYVVSQSEDGYALKRQNASDSEVDREPLILHSGLPGASAEFRGAQSINKGDMRTQAQGQSNRPTRSKTEHPVNLPPSLVRKDVPHTTKDRLARLATADDASNQRKEEEKSNTGQLVPAATIKRKRSPGIVSMKSRMPKMSSRPGRKYETQWRVGQAPTAGLRESKEQTNFDHVLAAVSRYYQGNADGTWKHAIRQNATEYDGKGLTPGIGTSIIMAAGLVAAGHTADATHVLDRTLPLAEVMLLSQHPQVFFWLLEVSTDTSQTVTGHVRRAVTAQFGPLAHRLLGPDHPISLLLTTPLTTEQRIRMRRQGQLVTHDYHVRTFGTYSYQTMMHQWYWARTTAEAGQYDEAMQLLQDLEKTWEDAYSTPNSAVVVMTLVERARVMVASGDAGILIECLLGDILRRIEVMSSAQSLGNPILDATELRLREGGLIFSQLAALRVLGRVHVMRRNLNAAILCFGHAVGIAEAGLSARSSVRKLCETDLEETRMMELERAMGVLSVEDPTSRLPPMSSIVSIMPIET